MNTAIQGAVSTSESYTDQAITAIGINDYLKSASAEAVYQKITAMVAYYTSAQTDTAIETAKS